jgi:hypothetical protein
MVELIDGREKASFGGEGADVKLIEDDFFPWLAAPADVPQAKSRGSMTSLGPSTS